MKYLFLLFTFTSFAANFHTKKFEIQFDAYLVTDLEDNSHAIKRQINHSFGPLMNLKSTGRRASLSHRYSFNIIRETLISDKLRKVEYRFKGFLLAEENLSLDKFKITMPIRTIETFNAAQRFRGRCGSNGNLGMFFHNWSPYYRNCGLIKGKHYEEFDIFSISETHTTKTHLSEEFLVNGVYNLFYYFGSDYFSNRRFGFAQKGFNETLKLYKRAGFTPHFDQNETLEIFNSNKLYSRYRRLKGSINGKEANIYIMLANPTDSTPSTEFEFFKFFKYAFKNASSIQYSGHAGLGSVLNFDALELKYKEKIIYNESQKQIFYMDGCNTYFYSSGFFFLKKRLSNSLILISNGATILTSHYKQAVHTIFSMFIKKTFNRNDIISNVNYYMRNARNRDFQMLDVSSN